jgi:hypothetical protein
MRTGIGRAVRYLLNHLFPRRAPAGEYARSTEHDRDPEGIAFAEILAASAVLDFGGLPVEPRMSPRSTVLDKNNRVISI